MAECLDKDLEFSCGSQSVGEVVEGGDLEFDRKLCQHMEMNVAHN